MRRGLGPGVFLIFGGKYLNYTLHPGDCRGAFLLDQIIHAAIEGRTEVDEVCAVWLELAALPITDPVFVDADPGGKLGLREAALDALAGDGAIVGDAGRRAISHFLSFLPA